MKRVALITGSVSTQKAVERQLKEFISTIDLVSYASEQNLPPRIECDLLIISSARMLQDLEERWAHVELVETDRIVCKRGIDYDRIDRLVQLAPGTDVLLVNDEMETAVETIEGLTNLGLSHINYHPYWPGAEQFPATIAVTPGEIDKVPAAIAEVIDIGPRILDLESVFEIIEMLELNLKALRTTAKRFFLHLLELSRNMAQVQGQVNRLNRYLNQIIGSLFGGMLVYDPEGRILHTNAEMLKMLGLRSLGSGVRNIKNYLGRELTQLLLGSGNLDGEPVRFLGAKVLLSKFYLVDSACFVVTTRMDDNRTESVSAELRRKGHVAKYRFTDIAGNSESIEKSKRDAERLARSDLSILIEGESGTGKELFASAIHNSSYRAQGPFLAVNCSAFPDELIESELFGYEEGAFTGAKKGGKVGLFELAEGGTLFLDEIGDMSPKVQTRLLRVLQEKEFRPIGSSVIKKVDVRVIAATNKNLAEQVELGLFRPDLYYRLKVGYVFIPPLRERPEDIALLAEAFVRNETSESVTMDASVLRKLSDSEWKGNARELENTIKYMLAVRSGNTLGMDDLPRQTESGRGSTGRETAARSTADDSAAKMPESDLLLLDAVYRLHLEGKHSSRTSLHRYLSEHSVEMTISQIRNRLRHLSEAGYLVSTRGPGGSKITRSGIELARWWRDRSTYDSD